MLRKLYVTTKAYGGQWEIVDGKRKLSGGHPILIGILTELEKERYRFEYKTGGCNVFRLMINEFPDVAKVYSDYEVDKFIYRIIPRPDKMYVGGIMKRHDIAEYDVWRLLVACGKSGVHDDAYLYEELPIGTRQLPAQII